MKIIVDTNIIFSALLNTNSLISDIIMNSTGQFEFYSVHYLVEEIQKHHNKLKRISKLSDIELIEAQQLILSKVTFISEEIIPFNYWQNALGFVRDVDKDDIAFVALSLYFNKVNIWTGDLKLIKGLESKGFLNCISTTDLLKLRNNLEI